MPCARRLKYIINLQAVLQPGDTVQAVKLTGAYDNDSASWPVISYLFGPDANKACNPVHAYPRPSSSVTYYRHVGR